MRNIEWYLYVFNDTDKKDLLKIIKFSKIKQLAYVVDLPYTVVSNYFHNLIYPRGLLKYCYIYQTKIK